MIGEQKEDNLEKNKKAKLRFATWLFYVIRLGLEPRTPTLKVLCSTS